MNAQQNQEGNGPATGAVIIPQYAATDHEWTFARAFLYSLTVLTTIGEPNFDIFDYTYIQFLRINWNFFPIDSDFCSLVSYLYYKSLEIFFKLWWRNINDVYTICQMRQLIVINIEKRQYKIDKMSLFKLNDPSVFSLNADFDEGQSIWISISIHIKSDLDSYTF